MKLAKNIILYLSAAFLIIGIHQTITLGFDVSYWIFMLTISMFLLYRLIGSADKGKKEKKPKPVKAMQDLKFLLTIKGKQPTSHPYINLGMPGMNMGPNQVKLTPARAGVYEGTGMIVRCPSGRRTWRALVTVPEIGEVSFTFDVVY